MYIVQINRYMSYIVTINKCIVPHDQDDFLVVLFSRCLRVYAL